jgi:hypothetical protein
MADRQETERTRSIVVTYQLKFSDLYWMWETSAIGLIGTVSFAALGLVFFSAVLEPAKYPVAGDVAVGLLFILLAPTLVPIVGSLASGKASMVGQPVRIVFDSRGIEGWQVAAFRTTAWDDLRHPRLESRVLVLPFSWPSADAWAVVPARAFSSEQFERLLLILQEEGVFLDGDRRSPMGRFLAFVADRVPVGRSSPESGHLAEFPRLPRTPRVRGTSAGG